MFIQPCLQSTIDAISVYEHTDVPNLLKVENILTSDLKDFQILATTTHKNSFKCNVQRMYIQAIVRHLTDRFPKCGNHRCIQYLQPAVYASK